MAAAFGVLAVAPPSPRQAVPAVPMPHTAAVVKTRPNTQNLKRHRNIFHANFILGHATDVSTKCFKDKYGHSPPVGSVPAVLAQKEHTPKDFLAYKFTPQIDGLLMEHQESLAMPEAVGCPVQDLSVLRLDQAKAEGRAGG